MEKKSKIEKLVFAGDLIENELERIRIKINKIIDYLNIQPQAEENELDKVYVEPYESANPEGAIKVEWKSRDEIADNLQAQFEYGRHGTYKDLESAWKVFDKERVKEWDRIAMETYKQATQSTPEQKEEWEKKWEEFFLYVTNNKNWVGGRPEWKGNVYITLYNAMKDFIKNLLSEREQFAKEELQCVYNHIMGADVDMEEYYKVLGKIENFLGYERLILTVETGKEG